MEAPPGRREAPPDDRLRAVTRDSGPALRFAACGLRTERSVSSLFANIRNSCAEVAASARWVAIDPASIEPYARTLGSHIAPLAHTAEHHLLGRGDDTLAFFVILDTINFGSGYSPYLAKDGASGYFTVAQRLKARCEQH